MITPPDLLLFAALASAPALAGDGAPAADPAPEKVPARTTARWFIGFRFGGGLHSANLEEWDGDRGGAGLALSPLHFGLVLRPSLVLELDGGGLTTLGGNDGALDYSRTVHSGLLYQAGLRLHPWADRGFYARVGLGVGMVELEEVRILDGATLDEAKGTGLGASLALGHEWYGGPFFSPGLQLSANQLFGTGMSVTQVDLQITARWYLRHKR